MPTHITGVIAHGQDEHFCFIDQIKWPADSNVPINILLTVLKYINQKVCMYSRNVWMHVSVATVYNDVHVWGENVTRAD